MIRFRDLSALQIRAISDGCGIVAKGLRVPDFIFKARCDIHDIYWCRGTGWAWNSHWFLPYSVIRWYLQGVYWLEWANIQFYYFMLKDAWHPTNQLLEKIFYSLLATMYFLAVCFVALIPSTKRMTNWRTIDEIVQYAQREKHGVV